MRRGFVLVEVLLALSVMALLASLVFVRLANSISQQELDGASRRMAAELRYLQQTTLNEDSSRDSHRMVFSADRYYIANGFTVEKMILLPASVRIYGSPADASFSRVTGGAAVGQSIQLQSKTLKSSLYVILYPNRGRVRIDDKPAN